jgi:hypothetical protein
MHEPNRKWVAPPRGRGLKHMPGGCRMALHRPPPRGRGLKHMPGGCRMALHRPPPAGAWIETCYGRAGCGSSARRLPPRGRGLKRRRTSTESRARPVRLPRPQRVTIRKPSENPRIRATRCRRSKAAWTSMRVADSRYGRKGASLQRFTCGQSCAKRDPVYFAGLAKFASRGGKFPERPQEIRSEPDGEIALFSTTTPRLGVLCASAVKPS